MFFRKLFWIHVFNYESAFYIDLLPKMYFTGIYWKIFVSLFVGFYNILLASFRICDKYGKYFSIVID